MNTKAIREFTDSRWDEFAVPELVDYIRIPNKSPMFDADWEANETKLMGSVTNDSHLSPPSFAG